MKVRYFIGNRFSTNLVSGHDIQDQSIKEGQNEIRQGGDERENSITSGNVTNGNGEAQFRTIEAKWGKGEREASQNGTVEHIPSASSGATTTESDLQQLISNCQAALAMRTTSYI